MLIYMFKLKDVLSDFRRIIYERVMESFIKHIWTVIVCIL